MLKYNYKWLIIFNKKTSISKKIYNIIIYYILIVKINLKNLDISR